MACGDLPYARSSSSFDAATLAAGGYSRPRIISTRDSTASRPYSWAIAFTSDVTLFGVPFLRPPVFGLPGGRPGFFSAAISTCLYFRNSRLLHPPAHYGE